VIDGVALINTPVAQDVRTPVKENYIPRLLAGYIFQCDRIHNNDTCAIISYFSKSFFDSFFSFQNSKQRFTENF